MVVAIRLEDYVGSFDTLEEHAWLRSFERQTAVEQRELCLGIIYSRGSDSDIPIFHGSVNQCFPWLKLFTRLCFPL